jgi:hypothetical protein
MKKEYKRPSSAFKNAELESIIAMSMTQEKADPEGEVLTGRRGRDVFTSDEEADEEFALEQYEVKEPNGWVDGLW